MFMVKCLTQRQATGNPSPKPDDGKTIFKGCMAKLNEAISLFSKTQETGAPPLSSGDLINKGNSQQMDKIMLGIKSPLYA
jgi:hypothetical protein